MMSTETENVLSKYQSARKIQNGKNQILAGEFDFLIDPEFVREWSEEKPNWGFSGVGEITYKRTYSRLKADGTNEEWFETVQRVVEGTYSMLHKHIVGVGSLWLPGKAQRDAQEMYERMFTFKFLPPGRGLWAMGSPITREVGLFAALNNCGFVSTRDIGIRMERDTDHDPDSTERVRPFIFLMSMSMLGVGVGFNTKGAGSFVVKTPSSKLSGGAYLIPDSRQGWTHSTSLLLQSYFYSNVMFPVFPDCDFDYSSIRPKGEPIRTFGGVAPGPEPLRKLHDRLRTVLDAVSGEPISETTIVDVMNLIGQCVLAGGVRRTAEIAFGSPHSVEFLNLKKFHTEDDPNPRMDWKTGGWGHTSNNSIYAKLGMDYSDVAQRTRDNGEPGYIWLQNVNSFGRMSEAPEDRIHEPLVAGANPCMEQSLRSYELCNLVETFPNNHANLNDFIRTLKFAFLYAKTVTTGMTEWEQTNEIIRVNRRIGCSMTGLAQFLQPSSGSLSGREKLIKWSRAGYARLKEYDMTYSSWLKIAPSVKITSIKPSGTVSLLAGATPGCHFPIATWYIRRITFSKMSRIVPCLEAAGYPVETSAYDENNVVVEFPVFCGDRDMPVQCDVSPREQLELAALLQKHWADNQVSVTVTFPKDTTSAEDIASLLKEFQYKLKGVSFLPETEMGTYPQMPYETITEEEFVERKRALKKDIEWVTLEQPEAPKFCDGDACAIQTPLGLSSSGS